MKAYVLACLLVLSALSVKAQTEDPEIVKVGDVMPAFTILFDDGSTFSSSALKGKVVLLNFFATWCPPCQKELPDMEATLWPKVKDNPSFALMVLGRSHTDAELKEYNDKKGFTFPLYPDRNRIIFDTFARSLIPRSYLIGKDGRVKQITTGYTEEEFRRLVDRIEQLLK